MGKFSVSFTLNLSSAPPPPPISGLVLAVVAVVAGGRHTGLMSRPTYNLKNKILLLIFFSSETNLPTCALVSSTSRAMSLARTRESYPGWTRALET